RRCGAGSEKEQEGGEHERGNTSLSLSLSRRASLGGRSLTNARENLSLSLSPSSLSLSLPLSLSNLTSNAHAVEHVVIRLLRLLGLQRRPLLRGRPEAGAAAVVQLHCARILRKKTMRDIEEEEH